jgi:hypothetical protein
VPDRVVVVHRIAPRRPRNTVHNAATTKESLPRFKNPSEKSLHITGIISKIRSRT